MMKLNERQEKIISYRRKHGTAGNKELLDHVLKSGEKVTRLTIVRDLEKILRAKVISKKGKGRNVRYVERIKNPALFYFDAERYFKLSPDEREVKFEKFNFDVFGFFGNDIFSETEIEKIEKLNNTYRSGIKKLPASILKKEFERLTIELSRKSSQIEGNTYSLIDTEILIREHREAKGHPKEEAIMILNHKNALDYILGKKSNFRSLNLRKIENIHSLLISKLSTAKGIRKGTVGITGTRYRPLDNQHQIRDAIEKRCRIAKDKKP